MKHVSFKYGFYAALVGFMAFGLSLYFGASEVLGYTAIVIALSFVFFGVKYFRDTKNEGKLNFGKALLLGMGISLFAAVGVALMDGLYVTVIDPDFFQVYGQAAVESAKEKGDATAISSAQEQLDWFTNMSTVQRGFFSGGFMFAIVTVIGFIVSLISGLILKKE